MKKAMVVDFNCVLSDLKKRIDTTYNYHEADCLITWQDVRGSQATLTDLFHRLGKPVIVVQHGRAATRDYNPPCSFKMRADRICVWGTDDAERMKDAGFGQKTVLTGSPLITRLKEVKMDKRKENFIIFVPVICEHESPFNIQTYWELKKLEYTYAQEAIQAKLPQLIEAWDGEVMEQGCASEKEIPYDKFTDRFYVLSKLTPIHDHRLYHGQNVRTTPNNFKHIETGLLVLALAKCLVGLEEGTYQLMGTFLNIPSVIVEGLRYGSFGGIKDYKTEIVHSRASHFCKLKDLRKTIEKAQEQGIDEKTRKNVLLAELGDPDSDPIESIINVASELAGGDLRIQQEELVHGKVQHC